MHRHLDRATVAIEAPEADRSPAGHHPSAHSQVGDARVVDPDTRADGDESVVAATEIVDRDEPLTPERQLATMEGLYRQLTATLEEMLPLLGLVLFGDPETAQRFYKESFATAMDRLGPFHVRYWVWR